jgi:hypothetical protein
MTDNADHSRGPRQGRMIGPLCHGASFARPGSRGLDPSPDLS